MNGIAGVALAAAATLLLGLQRSDPPAVIDLGPAPAGLSGHAVDVNDRGVVLGALSDGVNVRETLS